MSLAQIGEFAFVLLSRASNLHLVEVCYERTGQYNLHQPLLKKEKRIMSLQLLSLHNSMGVVLIF